MHECPNCKEPTFSNMKKAFMGPRRPAYCSSCKAKVAVPLSMSLYFVFYILVNYIISVNFGLKIAIITFVIITILFTYVYDRHIPLILHK